MTELQLPDVTVCGEADDGLFDLPHLVGGRWGTRGSFKTGIVSYAVAGINPEKTPGAWHSEVGVGWAERNVTSPTRGKSAVRLTL